MGGPFAAGFAEEMGVLVEHVVPDFGRNAIKGGVRAEPRQWNEAAKKHRSLGGRKRKTAEAVVIPQPPRMSSMLQRIQHGRTDLVFEYLSGGHPATSTDADGVPLVRWCAYHGDVSAIRHLLAQGESLSTLGQNLDLNGAAFHGHWQLCQFLIENGANVDYQHPDTGETALHAALCKANRPVYDFVVQILLHHAADPNVRTKAAAETGAFMRDCRTRQETPLHRAAAFGSERAIEMLLHAGARRDARDMNGDSPLSWASWHLRPARILRLLSFDGFSIHPENSSSYDHGSGWEQAAQTPHMENPD